MLNNGVALKLNHNDRIEVSTDFISRIKVFWVVTLCISVSPSSSRVDDSRTPQYVKNVVSSFETWAIKNPDSLTSPKTWILKTE
jgi:hypothetical protein